MIQDHGHTFDVTTEGSGKSAVHDGLSQPEQVETQQVKLAGTVGRKNMLLNFNPKPLLPKIESSPVPDDPLGKSARSKESTLK